MSVPLALGVAVGRADLGSAAALGGLTSVYGHALPYRRRAGLVAGCGAVVLAGIVAGAATGTSPVALSLVLGVLAAATTAATAIFRIGPPGPLMVVLTAGSASALGFSAGHVAAAAAGVVLSWLAVLAPWLWDPAGPERRAVRAAEEAVATRGDDVRPGVAARAVRTADAAVRAGSRRRPSLELRLHLLETRFLAGLSTGDLPAPPSGPVVPGRRTRLPVWALGAVRTGTGTAVAGLTAAALGLPSTYWASVAAVAALLGTGVRATGVRAAHRMVGTLVGIGIAGLLFAADLPVGVEVAVVGLLLVGVELLVAHQYVLAVMLITPLSLLLVHIGVPERSGLELAGTRVVETVLGIALALVAGLLLFPREASARLPTAVTAVSAAVRGLAAGTTPGRVLERDLIGLLETATAARAELRPMPATEAWLRRGRWAADLGWGLLGARGRGDDELERALLTRVRADL